MDWQQPNAIKLPHLDLKTRIEIKSPHISSGINLSVKVFSEGTTTVKLNVVVRTTP